MAIDRTGISSLDAGALDITYSGNEGPKSPKQIAGGEYNRVLELLEKTRESGPLSEEEKIELQQLIRTLMAKGVDVRQLMEGSGNMRMASADPILQDEYDKYVFQLKEIHPEAVPMTIEEFKKEAMSGMAEGGIARLGYRGGQLVQPGPGRPGYNGWGDAPSGSSGTPGQMGGGGHDWASDPNVGKSYGDQERSYSRSIDAGRGTETVTVSPKDYVTQKWAGPTQLPFGLEIGGGYVDYDPITGERITPPPLQTGGGETRLTPEQLEAIRKQKELEAILASQEIRTGEKEESDAMVAAIKQQEEEDAFKASLALADPSGLETLQYADNRPLQYSAHGGRVPAAYGGIMGNDGRRAYGLGSVFKPFKKAAKKAARAVKKVAKSPIGKAALLYLATAGLGNIMQPGAAQWGTPWGKAGSRGWLHPSTVGSRVGSLFSKTPSDNKITQTAKQYLESEGITINDENLKWAKEQLTKKVADPVVKKTLGQRALGHAAWMLPSLALMKPDFGAAPGPSMTDATGVNKAAADAWAKTHLSGLDEEDWQLTSASELTPLQYSAQGGRIGYQGGGYNDEDEEEGHRSAALSAMYGLRKNAQEGGLMDLGGMEKDYRQEGGFVPIGGQERADDVPARLSKNEFVFTADAVRAAGGGDIDAGAEVMENVMNNLEQGGQVSEESQGLEGARDMFATSQRLEGVL